MKRTLLGLVIGLLLGVSATWVYLHRSAAGPTASASVETAPVAREEAKDNPLHLSPAKRLAVGITLETTEERILDPVVPVFGRVLDATPLVTLAAELETAKAAYDASSKELERVKKLFANNNNASAQALETADAAASRDRAALSSAKVRLIASWGPRMADEKQLLILTESLASGQALIRLDVLTGDRAVADPKTAKVALVGSDEWMDVRILSAAPFADPQVQGGGFLALASNHAFPVGATLRGTIIGEGEAAKALLISRRAIVYHQGSAWVFALDEDDVFERRLVSVARTEGEKVALTSGLEADQQIVVTGAQQLLAAELQAGETAAEP